MSWKCVVCETVNDDDLEFCEVGCTKRHYVYTRTQIDTEVDAARRQERKAAEGRRRTLQTEVEALRCSLTSAEDRLRTLQTSLDAARHSSSSRSKPRAFWRIMLFITVLFVMGWLLAERQQLTAELKQSEQEVRHRVERERMLEKKLQQEQEEKRKIEEAHQSAEKQLRYEIKEAKRKADEKLQQLEMKLRKEFVVERRRWLAEERQRLEAGLRRQQQERVDVDMNPFSLGDRSARSKPLRNSLGMEFVWIPEGEFFMGSNIRDAERDEQPVRQVRISHPFYLGKYEVTQRQWKEVMDNNPSRSKGDDQPVENVSWEEVQIFIQQLNAKEGVKVYRLPTEAEWEYAARAGTTTSYSFGDDASQLGVYAWYADNAGQHPHEVGGKHPNRWGLYDMQGNVWEWVNDWYDKVYYKSSPSWVDPKGPQSGAYRVSRGGGWIGGAKDCRVANRDKEDPGDRDASLGFRLLRQAP